MGRPISLASRQNCCCIFSSRQIHVSRSLSWNANHVSIFARVLPKVPCALFERWITQIDDGHYVAIEILVDFSHGDLAPIAMSTLVPSPTNHGMARHRRVSLLVPRGHNISRSGRVKGHPKGCSGRRALCRQRRDGSRRRWRHDA